jgi:putative phosphoesterase
MRLAVLSDIHGNLVALEAVLADLQDRAPDQMINLGDCVTSPLWPRETFERLEHLAMPTVRGNHDRWLLEGRRQEMARSVAFTYDALTPSQRTTLATLPASIEVEGDVLAVHGTPADDTEYLLEESVDGRLALARTSTLRQRLAGTVAMLVLCGHSHQQHAACATGGTLVVNPGSVGCPRYADNDDPTIAEASSPHARYAIATRRKGRWSVELIALEYDWAQVTRQAVRNGREDWAAAFAGRL